jgi:autotransporter-associated beta strand protein
MLVEYFVNTAINLNVTGSAGNLTWVGGGANNWDLVGTANWTGHASDNRFYNGDSVTFSNSGSNSPNIQVVGTLAPGQVSFTNSSGKNYTLESFGTINVGGDFNVTNSGNVTLAHSGGTTVGGNFSQSGAGTFAVSTGDFAVSGNFINSGVGNVALNNGNITVTGNLVQSGSGTTTLANTGTLTVGGGITVSDGTLALNLGSDTTFGSSVSGTGTVRKQGTNTVTLTGNNSGFTGNMVVESGTLKTGAAGTLGTLAGITTVNDGATLDLFSFANSTESVVVGGAGVSGNGALIDTGAGTYNSPGIIGGLVLTSDLKIAASARSILSVQGTGASVTGNGRNVEFMTSEGAPLVGGTSNYSEVGFYNVGNTNFANLTIRGGGAATFGGNSTLGSAAGTVTIFDNSELGLDVSSVVHIKPIVIDGSGGGITDLRAGATLASNVQMDGSLDVTVWAINSDNTVNTMTMNGQLTGNGSLQVHSRSNGAGRVSVLVLNGNNSYSGTTRVGGGGGSSQIGAGGDRITLRVNGNHTGGGDYSVANLAGLGGSGSIASNVILEGGSRIGPGNSAGKLTIGGTLTTTNANFDWELGTLKDQATGVAGLDFDQLVVGGDLVLDSGTALNLDFGLLAESLRPEGGNAFWNASHSWKIIDTATNFGGTNFGLLVGGVGPGTWSLELGVGVDAGDIFLKYVSTAAHPGDFDSDGDVDGADFVAWQTNFPTPSGATLAQGDADGDSDVDGADFVVWQTNFPFTPGPGAAPVPEPVGLALLCTGGIGLIILRRRMHQ